MMKNNRPKVGVGVGVMILQGNKVLLGKRHSDPVKADSALHGQGTWTMPGGKLHFGESFEGAAQREILEETGLKLNQNALKLISLTNDIREDAHFVTVGFLLRDFEGEPQVMEPDEIVKWQWFDLSDLPRPIFPPSEKIIKNFLDKTVYKISLSLG